MIPKLVLNSIELLSVLLLSMVSTVAVQRMSNRNMKLCHGQQYVMELQGLCFSWPGTPTKTDSLNPQKSKGSTVKWAI